MKITAKVPRLANNQRLVFIGISFHTRRLSLVPWPDPQGYKPDAARPRRWPDHYNSLPPPRGKVRVGGKELRLLKFEPDPNSESVSSDRVQLQGLHNDHLLSDGQ